MAISLNSVLGFKFNLKLQAKYQHGSRSYVGVNSTTKVNPMTIPLQMYGSGSGGNIQKLRWGLCCSAADSDQIAANSSVKGSGDSERAVSDGQVSAVNPPSLDANEPPSRISEASSSSTVSSIKAPLTAKERLRAARVLRRYAESKPSKPEMGSKVLDALRESDKGKKKSRLPEAPTNLLDDSKRGLPKQGLTFQFPGGMIFPQLMLNSQFR